MDRTGHVLKSSRVKQRVFVFSIIRIIPTNAPVPACPHLSLPHETAVGYGTFTSLTAVSKPHCPLRATHRLSKTGIANLGFPSFSQGILRPRMRSVRAANSSDYVLNNFTFTLCIHLHSAVSSLFPADESLLPHFTWGVFIAWLITAQFG